jgi:hypothetical protein
MAGGADVSPNSISEPRPCSSTVPPRVLAADEHDGTGSQGASDHHNAGGRAVTRSTSVSFATQPAAPHVGSSRMLEALARGGHAPSSGSTPATSLATQALPPDTTGRHQMKRDPRGCGPPWRRMRSCGPGAAIWPGRPGARAPRSREGGLAVAHSILVIPGSSSQRPALSRAGEHRPWFAGCDRDSPQWAIVASTLGCLIAG